MNNVYYTVGRDEGLLIRLYKFIKGYLKIRVTGLAPERFINLCGNRNILLWGLCHHKDEYEMYVMVDDFRGLRPLFRKTKTKALIVSRYGLPFFLYRYRKRKLFAVGVLFCIVFLFVMSCYIWEIEISGNYTQTDDILLSYLSDQGIIPGIRKEFIDCEKIEKMIRQTYDDIIWTSVKIDGTSLYIQVKENQVVNQRTEKPISISGNIIAECDGTIAKIITRAGIPQVVPDTKVQKGDLLVSGTIPITGDDGSITGYRYVSPDADVLVETILHYQDDFSMQYQEKVFTGKTLPKYCVGYNNNVFYFPMRKNLFGEYDIITSEYEIRLFKDYKLPVFVGKQRIREYYTATKRYEEKQAEKIAQENFERYYNDLIKKGVQIIEKNVKINITNYKCKTKGTLTVIKSAGEMVTWELQKSI